MLWSRAPMPGVRSQSFSPRLAPGVAHRIASGNDGPPVAFAPRFRWTPCESSARGVGHAATVRRFGAPSALAARPAPEVASQFVGVGQSCAAMLSGIPAPLPLFAVTFSTSRRASHVSGRSPSLATHALGVGHCIGAPPNDEQPLPPVRGANVGRADGADGDPVSEVAKPGNDD